MGIDRAAVLVEACTVLKIHFTFCYEIKEFFKNGHENEMNRALGHFVHI